MTKFKIQEKAIEESANELGLDTHISRMNRVTDLYTGAEKLMEFSKNKPYKKSYLWCDKLDVCFFFDENNKACFSMSGRWTSDSKDLTNHSLYYALGKIKRMVSLMDKKYRIAIKENNDARQI